TNRSPLITNTTTSPTTETPKFPTELWMHILKHLDHVDVCRLSQTSKFFHIVSNDDSVWRRICMVNGVKPKTNLIEVLDEINDEIVDHEPKEEKKVEWKVLFMEHYENERMYRFRRRSFW
ncbi:hypothetical protein BC829DRAFT_389404, partial [Chytridium lagenaria]